MLRLRPQFRLLTLLLVMSFITVILAVWPKPLTEVALGTHDFVLTSGERVSCGISVVTHSPDAVVRASRQRADQIRHEVRLASLSVTPEDMRDPALREFKRELLARINRIVGGKRVDRVLFSRFHLRSTD